MGTGGLVPPQGQSPVHAFCHPGESALGCLTHDSEGQEHVKSRLGEERPLIGFLDMGSSPGNQARVSRGLARRLLVGSDVAQLWGQKLQKLEPSHGQSRRAAHRAISFKVL